MKQQVILLLLSAMVCSWWGCSTPLDMNASDVFFAKGLAQYKSGDYEHAIFSFKKAINHNPQSAKAYLWLGLARRYVFGLPSMPIAGGRFGTVIYGLDDIDKAIELSPGYVEAYYYRGAIFEAEKFYRRAMEDYRKVVSLSESGMPPTVASSSSRRRLDRLEERIKKGLKDGVD